MQRPSQKQGTDVIQELIEDCLMAYPVSPLLISLYKQYAQRGFLTRKQMQGLYAKAAEAPGVPPGRLATLEAIIKKMPNRIKSALPENAPLYQKDGGIEAIFRAILEKYPRHKGVLGLKSKFDDNIPLSPLEETELKRLHKLLK